MGKIFILIGKSSSGKDSIYQKILDEKDLNLKKVVPYTTRPIREGEVEGGAYHFCNEEMVRKLQEENKIIELRAYDTIHGIWKYFTVNDGQINLLEDNYLMVGVLQTYLNVAAYFGNQSVVPIYIEVEDGERLLRALLRERKEEKPKYEEMCRRFLADSTDFSEENLKKAGITKRFENIEIEKTVDDITQYIREEITP